MLSHLRIRDFALIEELDIEFGNGLNILTGETGAGKSIIINALGLVLGEKARLEDIRTGASKAIVEAVFETNGVELFIRREITPSGKGRILINEELSSLARLKEIGERLVDIHGQHTHQSLLYTANHIDLLDGSGRLTICCQELACEFNNYLSCKRELAKLEEELSGRERKIDLLRFQIEEIEGARLIPGEEEELLHERRLLRNAESLFRLSDEAYKALYEDEIEPSICTKLTAVKSNLRQLAQIDDRVSKPLYDQFETASVAIQEIAFELRGYRDRIEFSSERLSAVEERLDILGRIKRRYGGSIEEAIRSLDGLKRELSEIDHGEERIEDLQREIGRLSSCLFERSLSLSEERKKQARQLEREVAKELAQLGMKETSFKVDIRMKGDGEKIERGKEVLIVGPKGCDEVEFLIMTNPGEGLKPLTRIASGGELSRIMLALKGILAKVDKIPVLIFDEIDVGIGGRMARVVGERLLNLAQSHQVICITHLPQIASLADTHFRVEKFRTKGRMTTRLEPLNPEERVWEIARMIGGERVGETTLKQAREMIGR